MELSYLKKLIRLLEKSEVDEIEIEEEGVKVRLAKNTSSGPPQPYNLSPASAATAQPVASAPSPQAAAAPAKPDKVLHEIKSPIVGTFYRAPAPDADPYVEIGQVVQAGTILCIVEAMKLMNEIESDAAGRLVKVAVENGQPVEYNQTLFFLEPV